MPASSPSKYYLSRYVSRGSYPGFRGPRARPGTGRTYDTRRRTKRTRLLIFFYMQVLKAGRECHALQRSE
ncbi:hypothetical protein O3P69_004179 [Scylla paramamosain]|uniref:Uncharacterized protein n=1 Tax=Scylla paramamosain TaxID=85552 RepID=A0AAW0UGY1_SCYPA